MREMKECGIQWIPEIPSNWKVLRGKSILRLLKRSSDSFTEVITCFRDGEVTLRKNRREEGFTFSDKEIGYQGICNGDLVIHGMDGFAGAIGISDSDGKGSPVLVVCDSNENKKYLVYYLRLLATQNVFVAIATGIRERSCDLRWNKIADLLFPIPPVSEQNKIVDYLDEKCAKIDAVIEKQKQVIEKLKEYKFSVLYDLFLNGIDNEAIKWTEFRLGDIASYKKGPFGSAITISMFVEKANDTFKIYEQKNAIYKDATLGHYYINEGKYKELESFSVLPNDIIVSCAGTIGQCYILPENAEIGIINQALMRVRVFENYDVNYVCELLNVLLIEIADEFSNGSAIKNIPPFSVLKKYKIRIPDLKRQKELITYIKNEKEKIDSAIAKKQAIIEKLTEYKKSLIYEVVTGKKEV